MGVKGVGSLNVGALVRITRGRGATVGRGVQGARVGLAVRASLRMTLLFFSVVLLSLAWLSVQNKATQRSRSTLRRVMV